MDNYIFNKIIDDIEQQRLQKQNIIVAVCGGSCTRKSSLIGASLVNYFQDECVLISQDQFQHQPKYLNNIHPVYRRDHPNNFGLEASFNALQLFKNNQPISIPNYQFKKDETISNITINPKPITIFEGMYTNFRQLQEINDISIYAYSPWYARMIRRIYRNTLDRYKGKFENEILATFSNSVTLAHQMFVKSQKINSDYCLHVPLDFQQIIHYYKLQPLPLSGMHMDTLFSFVNEVTVNIVRNEKLQTKFQLYFQNKLYADFDINDQTLLSLNAIDWSSY